MWTKALEKMLSACEVQWTHAFGREACGEARAELEAIHKAAKALSANAYPNNKETGIALALMDDIAREGP